MDYHARFYDPYLNRWTQPDSIVSNSLSPQAFNRYSYVSNNPINYIDPTGHYIFDDDPAIMSNSGNIYKPSYFYSPSDAQTAFGVPVAMRVTQGSAVASSGGDIVGLIEDAKPDGHFVSLGFSVSKGVSPKDFWTGSVDIVRETDDTLNPFDNHTGVFTSPRIKDPAIDEIACSSESEKPPQFLLPTIGVTVSWGDIYISGHYGNFDVLDYSGPYIVDVAGVNLGLLGAGKEIFTAADRKTGKRDWSLFGVGNTFSFGPGFDLQAGQYAVNSTYRGTFNDIFFPPPTYWIEIK